MGVSQDEFELYAPEFVEDPDAALEERLVYPLGLCLDFARINYGQEFYESRTLPVLVRLIQYFEDTGLKYEGDSEYDNFLLAIFAASAVMYATEFRAARAFNRLEMYPLVFDYAYDAMRPRLRKNRHVTHAIKHTSKLREGLFEAKIIAVTDRIIEAPYVINENNAREYLRAVEMYLPLIPCTIVDGISKLNPLIEELGELLCAYESRFSEQL